MQVFSNKESIGSLTKTGNTTVQLSPSVITIGAKQYSTGNLVCDLAVNGIGGLDAGSVSIEQVYYIFLVIDGTNLALICSLNKNQPLGFTSFKKIAGILTNESYQIDQVSTSQLIPKQQQDTFSARISGSGVVSEDNFGLISGNASISGTSKFNINFTPGLFAEIPHVQAIAVYGGDNRPPNAYIVNRSISSVAIRISYVFTSSSITNNPVDGMIIFVHRASTDILPPIEIF